jgi:FMN phosphatase YigB (HAD superfamily)
MGLGEINITARSKRRTGGESTRPTTPAELPALIARFPIVSCDVFDTAITRSLARAADVHLATGARARARGLIACSAEAFREYRLEAERAVRQALTHPDEEVRLAEVYQRLAQCNIVADPGTVASVELAVERSVALPIVPIRYALATRRPGQRLIFVSDTILPGEWVAQLLTDCGYGEEPTVFTSADLGDNKYSGRLFPKVIEGLGCSPADIVHIGDHPISDIARARESGITALHVTQPRIPAEPEGVAPLHHVARLVHSRRRTLATRAPDATAPPDLFRYCSLLLIGFTLFVLAEARRRGIRRIYFLARDGHIPMAIARRIVASTGQPLEPTYLYASRQAISLPALGNDPDGIADLIRRTLLGRPLGVGLDIVGIGQAITPQMLRDAGLDPDKPAIDAASQDAFRRLLRANSHLIRAETQERRAAALAYLEQSGFLAPGPRLIVDVGWRGSIQKGLVSLTGLPATDVIGCYLGLLPEALAPGFDIRTTAAYLFSFGQPKPVMDKVFEGYALCEFFLSAPHTATTHYAFDGDKAMPVLAVEPEPAATIRRQAVTAIETQCLTEVDALDTILDGAWPDEVDPASALFDLDPLLTKPTARQVAEIGAIRFIGGFDNTPIETAVRHVPLSKFLRDPDGAIRQLGSSPWRAGAVRASLPWPLPSMTFPQFRDRASRLLNFLRHA